MQLRERFRRTPDSPPPRNVLSLALRLAVVVAAALATLAAGSAPQVAGGHHEVAPGLRYRHMAAASPAGEPWSIHILELDRGAPGLELRAVAGTGETGHMARVLPTEMAAAVPGALAVVNGDYDLPFPYLGVSDGLAVTSRRLWTTGRPGWPVLAILEGGQPAVAVPEVSLELAAGRRRWSIAALNKPLGGPQGGTHGRGPRVFTSDFRPEVQSEAPFTAVVIGELAPELPLEVDRRTEGVVLEVVEETTRAAIPPGTLVAAELRSGAPDAAGLAALRPGDRVSFEARVRVAGRGGVRDAVGGAPVLVRNARPAVGGAGEYLRQRHPRTAACYDRERILFVVVDGRQPELSVGMTLEELAALMVSLGCEVALNTDGGGSSVMAVALPAAASRENAGAQQQAARPSHRGPAGPQGDPAAPLQIVNSPSDGRERGRGNAWVIVRR